MDAKGFWESVTVLGKLQSSAVCSRLAQVVREVFAESFHGVVVGFLRCWLGSYMRSFCIDEIGIG